MTPVCKPFMMISQVVLLNAARLFFPWDSKQDNTALPGKGWGERGREEGGGAS